MLRGRFAILDPSGWTPIVWITVLLRIAAMSLIPFDPLGGMLASFFMDWFDAYLLIQRARISRAEYHTLDKNLDQLWSVVMLAVGWGTPYRWVLAGLYLYRLVGHAVYLAVHDTRVFLFFPNVFEFAFFWFVALAPWLGPYNISHFRTVTVVLTVVKLLQEAGLHWFWPAALARMKKRRRGYPRLLKTLGWRNLGI